MQATSSVLTVGGHLALLRAAPALASCAPAAAERRAIVRADLKLDFNCPG